MLVIMEGVWHKRAGQPASSCLHDVLTGCAMQSEESLVVAERLEVRAKQAAYELSYQLLDGGPGLLADRQRWLQQAVAAFPPGTGLPVALERDLFAWKNATYMAQRRVSWDLPSADSILISSSFEIMTNMHDM